MTSDSSKLDQYKLQATIHADTVDHKEEQQTVTWIRETKLGAGSFGEVWREKELISGKLRAVKVIPKVLLKSNRVDYKRELEMLVELKDVSLLK